MGGKAPRCSLPTRQDRVDRESDLARRAARVQSVFRGFSARLLLKKRNSMAALIQGLARGFMARKGSPKRPAEPVCCEPPPKRSRVMTSMEACQQAALAAASAAKFAAAEVDKLDV